MPTLFEQLFEPDDSSPDGRELRTRLLLGTIGLILYFAPIVALAAIPDDGNESTLGAVMQMLLLLLVLAWFVANGLLVISGNVLTTIATCVFFWWLAYHLAAPDSHVFASILMPFLGGINLVLLLIGHAILVVTRERTHPQDDEGADGASQSPP